MTTSAANPSFNPTASFERIVRASVRKNSEVAAQYHEDLSRHIELSEHTEWSERSTKTVIEFEEPVNGVAKPKNVEAPVFRARGKAGPCKWSLYMGPL